MYAYWYVKQALTHNHLFLLDFCLHSSIVYGKCKEYFICFIIILVMSPSSSSRTADGPDQGYNRKKFLRYLFIKRALVVGMTSAAVFFFSGCNRDVTDPQDINGPTDNWVQDDTTFIGTIQPAERPADDIAYDYKIVLDNAREDPLNAFGDIFTTQIYIFSNVYDFAEYLDQHVVLRGEVIWWYAEHRILSVQEVHLLE